MSNKELPSMLSLWNQAGGLAITKFLYTAVVLVVSVIIFFVAYSIVTSLAGVFPTFLNVILFLVLFPFALMAFSIPSLVLYSLFVYGRINPENVYYMNAMIASLKMSLYIALVALPFCLFLGIAGGIGNPILIAASFLLIIPPIIIFFRFVLIPMIAFFEGKKFAEAKEESTEIMVGKKFWFFGLVLVPAIMFAIPRSLIDYFLTGAFKIILSIPLECFAASFSVATFLLFYKHVKGDPREVMAMPE